MKTFFKTDFVSSRMKKIIHLLLVSFASLLIISCANDSEAETVAQPAQPLPSTAEIPNSTVVPASNTAVVLNPAHGLPGHRCDLAVGAPLNSVPAVNNTPVSNAQPGQIFPLMNRTAGAVNNAPDIPIQPLSIPPSNTLPVSNNVTAGLNPAHGQPNHRCDISVGAPLNSPPGNTATSTQAPTTPTPPLTNAEGLKLNPPHGQPGHDCSVEVGKPLKEQ